MEKQKVKHLVSLSDLSNSDIDEIVSRGADFSSGSAQMNNLLTDKIVGIYFRKTSTRTRTSFSSAALRMGAQIISYGPNDLQENTGETVQDSTEVLSRMLHCLVARTAGSCEEMRCFASQDKMAVINAMTAKEHPTQAIADLITIRRHFGKIEGLRIAYVGEGNNTASALALSLSRYSGVKLCFYTPKNYGLDQVAKECAEQLALQSGADIKEYHELKDIDKETDIIYTTRWQTTGTSKPDPNWRDAFEPFKLTSKFMSQFTNAVFMHDLPAHRGEEVDAEVIDGSLSIVFDQAENKLHAAAAVLEWCLCEKVNPLSKSETSDVHYSLIAN
ncbi:ornithine carbamoyltransferase [Fulvivirga ligni]|uniref:ornithine carbamoyltransferase n=1 Tax=Fulvivirga ligni TaxID=2904246 RepID=UPI001F2FF944|nr:hypothetical protein [Fulvivirga ligni]UII23752.1 hypothetical protein LVD16_11020 [Fulvivirga ligni]